MTRDVGLGKGWEGNDRSSVRHGDATRSRHVSDKYATKNKNVLRQRTINVLRQRTKPFVTDHTKRLRHIPNLLMTHFHSYQSASPSFQFLFSKSPLDPLLHNDLLKNTPVILGEIVRNLKVVTLSNYP